MNVHPEGERELRPYRQRDAAPEQGNSDIAPVDASGVEHCKKFFQALIGRGAVSLVGMHQLREGQSQCLCQRFQGIDVGKAKPRFP